MKRIIEITFVLIALCLIPSSLQAQDDEDAHEYYGARDCGSCHRGQRIDDTAHALALQDFTDLEERDWLADFESGEDVRRVQFPDEDAPRPFTPDDIVYAIGSGRYVQRYLYALDDKQYRVFPAEWNTLTETWEPFTLAEDWSDEAYDWGSQCAACHTTGYSAETGEWVDDGVQCESCHGPGGKHIPIVDELSRRAEPEEVQQARDAIYLSPDPQMCGQCHSRGAMGSQPFPTGYYPGEDDLLAGFTLVETDDPTHWWITGHARQPNMQFNEWLNSAHASATETLKASPRAVDECLTCHNADYRWTQEINERFDKEDWEGVPPAITTLDTAQYGITCIVCHNPHSEEHHDALLDEEPYDLCVECHSNANYVSEGLHHPAQEMFEGLGMIDGVDGVMGVHFGEEAGPRCYDCHMADLPVDGSSRASHALAPVMPLEAEEGEPSACSACHDGLSASDLQYLIDDTQASIRDRIVTGRARMTSLNPDQIGERYQQIQTALDFVQNDGSLGVHNYAYADALLDFAEISLSELSTGGEMANPTEAPAPTSVVLDVFTGRNVEAESEIGEVRPTAILVIGTILFLVMILGGLFYWRRGGIAVLFLLCFALVVLVPDTALAQEDTGDENAEEAQASNDYCLLCHADSEEVWTLPSGETLSLHIDPEVLADSVHGADNPEGALACADCHLDFRFPHQPSLAQTVRDFQLERYASCRTCHEEQYLHAQDSVHAEALRSGQESAAVCVDCHGGHDIQSPNEPREQISLTCGECHGAILEKYQTSVHGEALFTEQNPDVPTCIDCHGVHNIANPTTTLFRNRSPQLCEQCHADDALMEKYDISTNVFDSYLTDFHGSTVALFEQHAPDTATNKAVCYDCHGVHDIAAVKDGDTSPIRENLLVTCQQCHPDADDNFSSAWIGHYPTTLKDNPAMTLSDWLYRLLVPLVGGLSLTFIFTDLFRRTRGG